MVAAEQDVGHAPAAELDRAGVLRELEEAAGEAVIGRALLVAEHAGEEPHDGIDDDAAAMAPLVST